MSKSVQEQIDRVVRLSTMYSSKGTVTGRLSAAYPQFGELPRGSKEEADALVKAFREKYAKQYADLFTLPVTANTENTGDFSFLEKRIKGVQ